MLPSCQSSECQYQIRKVKHIDTDIIISNGFLAPETLRKGRFTERSDVYAFGALLCVLFTEKPLKELILGSDPCCRSNTNSEDEDESLDSLHPNSDEEEDYTWYGDHIAYACTTHLKTNVLQQGNEMQMSKHKKVMKLLCKYIVNAVAFLHHGFSKTITHRASNSKATPQLASSPAPYGCIREKERTGA
ncbi:hypothetical protein FEM48_Zijuj05G0136700 [Ziziphus jujuba var. spinosa]|uniref:Serine-threonine/tyrosine-protein kinase catalytic domain-containing protein n=1 Tax=Ziziphus jujuba var. spinosa TaxID=714518 RepID=A0A978VF57_ZIZJJ|nr:hypothetical protein FEM48_Zijuj05G0136700 [Ziziphus jujuba var. spinosa]